MTNEFDKLIRDAAPDVPDPGPSRRATHTLLRDRMRRDLRRERIRRRQGLSLAASVALLSLVLGSATELGSGSFDFAGPGELKSIPAGSGEEIEIRDIEVGFGEQVTVAEPELTDDDIREYLTQVLLGDGEITGLMGIEIDGQTHWTVEILRNVNGHEVRGGEPLSGPGKAVLPAHKRFARNHMANLIERKSNEEPAGTFVREFEGLRFAIRYWKFEYPDFGPVVFYEGTPTR